MLGVSMSVAETTGALRIRLLASVSRVRQGTIVAPLQRAGTNSQTTRSANVTTREREDPKTQCSTQVLAPVGAHAAAPHAQK